MEHFASGRAGSTTVNSPFVTGYGLTDWIDEPHARRGLAFASDVEGEDFFPYSELAERAKRFSRWLQVEGVERETVVPIVVPTGPDFVAAFFGSLAAGSTPSPLVPPYIFEDLDDYTVHLARLLSGRRVVVTIGELRGIVEKAAAKAGGSARVLVLPDVWPDTGCFERAAPAEYALVQFTSGSSSAPRGVRVTAPNLEKMLEFIFRWIPGGEDDEGALWLPMYHDFGLVGGMLTATISQRTCWTMRPEQFVLQPERWIDRFGRHGAAFTAAPGFALGYVMKKVDPGFFEGCDFRGWKGAVLGGERLNPQLLERFAQLLEPYGFDRSVFMPGYGMAETTLGVCGVIGDEVPTAIRPDWSGMSFGKQVTVLDHRPLGPGHDEDHGNALISCGFPHRGNELRIVDEQGAELPEGYLGEIVASGPTVADGYEVEGTAAGTFSEVGVRTGDAGVLIDGELFVVGRLGDSIKVHGRNVFADDLEAKLAAVEGIGTGKCVAISGVAGDGEIGVAVLVESDTAEWAQAAEAVLESLLGDVGFQLCRMPRATIMRTSSGKPRRREMWKRLLDGDLQVAPAVEDPVAPA